MIVWIVQEQKRFSSDSLETSRRISRLEFDGCILTVYALQVATLCWPLGHFRVCDAMVFSGLQKPEASKHRQAADLPLPPGHSSLHPLTAEAPDSFALADFHVPNCSQSWMRLSTLLLRKVEETPDYAVQWTELNYSTTN